MTDYKIRVETELYDKLSPGFKKSATVVKSSSGEINKAFLDIVRLSNSMEKSGDSFFDRIKTSTRTALTSTRQYNEEVSLLKQNLKATSAVKILGDDFGQVKNKILDINVSIFEQQAKIAEARKKQIESQKNIEQNASKAAKTEAEKAIRLTKKLEDGQENLLRSKDRLLSKQDNQIAALRKEGVEVEKLGAHLQKLAEKEKSFRSEMGQRKSILGQRSNYRDVFDTNMERAANLSMAAGSAFAVGEGILNQGQRVYGKGLPLEQAIGDASAAGYAGQGVAAGLRGKTNLRKVIFDATSGTSLSPTGSANIAAEILKAGDKVSSLEGPKGKANLQALSKLSIIGKLGYGDTADLATTIKNQFGESDYEAISDKLTNLANLTKTNLPEIANFAKYAGVLAKDYGVSFDKTGGIGAALAEGGIRGEQAGTTTRDLLFRLFSPDSATKQVYAQMGINRMKDGQWRPPEAILHDILKATSKLNKEQRAEVFNTISGVASAPGFRILLNAAQIDPKTNKSRLKGFEEQLAGSKGATDEYYRISQDKTEAATQRLGGAFERLSSVAMLSVEISVTSAIKTLSKFTEALTKFASLNPTVAAAGAAVGLGGAALALIGGVGAKLLATRFLFKAVAQRGALSLITGGLFGGGAAAGTAAAAGAGGAAAVGGGIALGPILSGIGILSAVGAGAYGITRLMQKYRPPTGGTGGLSRAELEMFDETKYPPRRTDANIKVNIDINNNSNLNSAEIAEKTKDRFLEILKEQKDFMNALNGVDQ